MWKQHFTLDSDFPGESVFHSDAKGVTQTDLDTVVSVEEEGLPEEDVLDVAFCLMEGELYSTTISSDTWPWMSFMSFCLMEGELYSITISSDTWPWNLSFIMSSCLVEGELYSTVDHTAWLMDVQF